MTTGPRPQCLACVRLHPLKFNQQPTCDAFPAGIPDEVFDNERDHRQPIEGDNGLQFLVKPGDEFPEYAFR